MTFIKRKSTAQHLKPKSVQSAGFTLLEVMIVVVIMAALIAVGLPQMGKRNNELKATVRRLTVLTKEIRTRARLNNVTYRLVIDMKDGSGEGEPHSYWVEKSNQLTLVPEEGFLDEDERDEEADKKPLGGFQMDAGITKPKELGLGLVFDSVEVAGQEQPITAGKAYIHFFPHGLVEESAIHIKLGDDIEWTMAIHPLTGYADLVTKHISLEDIQKR